MSIDNKHIKFSSKKISNSYTLISIYCKSLSKLKSFDSYWRNTEEYDF